MPKIGFKHTDDAKKKMSLSKTGKKLSETHCKNMGLSHLGLKRTEASKKKMSEAQKGKKLSPETCRKMSESHKGIKLSGTRKEAHHKRLILMNHGKKGVKLSTAHRRKMSEAGKGKKHSLEHRRKIGESQKGDKSHNWKGGLVPLKNLIRKCFQYCKWRSDIFTRDCFTCQVCGLIGGKLNADHIKAFILIFEENKIKTLEEALICEELWNINNGRTLCEDCHRKTDNYGNKKQFPLQE